MGDDRQRQERSLRIIRVSRWIVLPFGVLVLAFGVWELTMGSIMSGLLNALMGFLFIAQGILYFLLAKSQRRRLALLSDGVES